MRVAHAPGTRADLATHGDRVCVVMACQDYAVATWSNVFAIIWRHETTPGAVRTVRAACERFGADHPEGVLLVTIVLEKAPGPSAAARSALAEFLKAADYIRASAVVMEGQSFRAAFVRGVVTGLTLLARQPFPHQVCSLQDAGALFEKESRRAGKTFERASFASVITEMREAIERQLAR